MNAGSYPGMGKGEMILLTYCLFYVLLQLKEYMAMHGFCMYYIIILFGYMTFLKLEMFPVCQFKHVHGISF